MHSINVQYRYEWNNRVQYNVNVIFMNDVGHSADFFTCVSSVVCIISVLRNYTC